MASFWNQTQHTVVMVGYRADGLKFKQDAPEIPPGKIRYVTPGNTGDDDWFIMVAYMKGATIPDRIGVTQSESGAGGGGEIGISILGIGGSLGASGDKSKTTFYSDSMAAVQAGPTDLFNLGETFDILNPDDYSKRQWFFVYVASGETGPPAPEVRLGW